MSATYTRYGSLSDIENCLAPFRPRRILLVTGRRSYEACGAKAIIDTRLSDYHLTHFYDFDINPKLEDAVRGAKLAIASEIDLILAIGGGSPMDIAKLIKAFMPDVANAENIATAKAPVAASSIPLITVPTTAGSGSEATHFAVVYIGKDKYSLASPHLSPDAFILDGQLLKTASPYQRAVNGLDAMAQALEGAWAVNSTHESRALSYEALELLVEHLPAMISSNTPDDLQNVLRAAHLAGQVINTTKTTAAHAFSYAFSSYHDVPHGHAVWMTLPAIFDKHVGANPDAIQDPRGPEHVSSVLRKLSEILGIPLGASCETHLKNFMRSIGVEPDMIKMGADTATQRQFLSQQVNAERLGNNPVKLSPTDIADIFNY